MSEEEITEKIKEIFEEYDVTKIYKFEYIGTNRKGKKKYKIKYISKYYPSLVCEDTFEEV